MEEPSWITLGEVVTCSVGGRLGIGTVGCSSFGVDDCDDPTSGGVSSREMNNVRSEDLTEGV